MKRADQQAQRDRDRHIMQMNMELSRHVTSMNIISNMGNSGTRYQIVR